MIQHIEIEPTYKTPKVVFDPKNGDLIIQGKSILVNVEEFYNPLLNWMTEFIDNPTSERVKFVFDIEYTNVASTKRFLFFLFKLKELKEKGVQVEVDWQYVETDKSILEVGKDLSQMLDLPFNFIGYKKLHRKESFLN